MNALSVQLTSIVLLVLGEAISVFSEMRAAQLHDSNAMEPMQIFSRSTALICLAGAFLIAGYMLGYRAFKSIWMVSVISVTSILIVEPVLAYGIFSEFPSRGALIGFVLGALGFVATWVF